MKATKLLTAAAARMDKGRSHGSEPGQPAADAAAAGAASPGRQGPGNVLRSGAAAGAALVAFSAASAATRRSGGGRRRVKLTAVGALAVGYVLGTRAGKGPI